MERQATPLWDATLDFEQRLDWLLSALSLEEKLNMLSTLSPEIARLGIRSTYLGEVAPHGVEAKHDRRENWGPPRATTTFPQPLGMSQSWDPGLMEKIGSVVSCEARILYEAEGRRGGICRWSPMAEPARDPRWGRTEESFGEDPLLAGVMSAAYTRGLRGSDPDYIRTAATLRQFYACSRETSFPEASVDPRSAAEYYTEPYRRCVTEGGAEAVMAADNVINGMPGLLNPELKTRVREEWKLSGHIVGAEGGLRSLCERTGADAAEVLAEALMAGVDCFADDPDYVSAAAHEAYDRGLLTATLLNRAIRNTFRTRLRLGMFNRDEDAPFAPEDPGRLACPEHGELARTAGQRSIVLLKNENGTLPLTAEEGDTIAVIGPLADEWFKDWNGGIPPCRITPCDGIREAYAGCSVTYTDGKERIRLFAGGQYLRLADDCITGTESRSEAEEFVVTEWGEDKISLQATTNGRYVTVCEDGLLRATREEAFGKPVRECFLRARAEEGITLSAWNGQPVAMRDGRLGLAGGEGGGDIFRTELAWDGLERAAVLASEAKAVVLVLGTNPVIGCCAGLDRKTLSLPEAQKKLFDRVFEANRNLALVIVSNYPHSTEGFEDAPAILFAPSGCQALGQSLADVLSGRVSPSGHLTMTWYRDETVLPDPDEYDILASDRTYQYLGASGRRPDVTYPFGYGLSYTSFSCEAFTLEKGDSELTAAMALKNTGERAGSVLVRLYSRRESGEGRADRLRLIAFRQVFLEAGQSTEVTLMIPWRELMEFDVVTESMVLPEGEYRIWLGDESAKPVRLHQPVLGQPSGPEPVPGEEEDEPEDLAAAVTYLEGDIRMRRDFANITAARLFDSSENIRLKTEKTWLCATVKDLSRPGVLIYDKGENSSLSTRMRMTLWGMPGSVVKVEINQKESFSFDADTSGQMTEQELALSRIPEEDQDGFARIRIELSGEVGLLSFWFAPD